MRNFYLLAKLTNTGGIGFLKANFATGPVSQPFFQGLLGSFNTAQRERESD